MKTYIRIIYTNGNAASADTERSFIDFCANWARNGVMLFNENRLAIAWHTVANIEDITPPTTTASGIAYTGETTNLKGYY